MMTEESTNFRLDRLEADIRELKTEDKEHCKNLTTTEKSILKSEQYVEQIFGMLKELRLTLQENLNKTSATEILALNLKKVTDDLSDDLKTVTAKVIEIEQKPVKSYEKMKWLFITFIVSNILGIAGLAIKILTK